MIKNKKVIHIIHAKTSGGIETGALKAQKFFKYDLCYRVQFIFNLKDSIFVKFYKSISLFLYLKKKLDNNYIIISSLWLSHIICFFLKISFTRFYWISFLHNSNYPTAFNKMICTKLTLASNKRVFDSFSTAKSVYNKNIIDQNNIINFYFKDYKFPKFNFKIWNKRDYDFIIVARNTNQKGFNNLEKFIEKNLSYQSKKFKLLIITDNFQSKTNLIKIKNNLKNLCKLYLKKNISNENVIKYLNKSKYYLCLSNFEGFGISIAEALKCGCFILTTNVGEQKYYLYTKRKKIIQPNQRINFSKIEKYAMSKKNFQKSIKYFDKRVNFYTDQIKNVVSNIN